MNHVLLSIAISVLVFISVWRGRMSFRTSYLVPIGLNPRQRGQVERLAREERRAMLRGKLWACGIAFAYSGLIVLLVVCERWGLLAALIGFSVCAFGAFLFFHERAKATLLRRLARYS